jgi:hypothetical protein
MAIGATAAITGGIVAGLSVAKASKVEAAWAVPGGIATYLQKGKWEIYQLTGTVSGSSAGPFSYSQEHDGPVTIDSTDIHITDPAGRVVVPHERFSSTRSETYTTGSRIYTGVASFDTPASGTYRVSVASSQPGQVILATSPFAALARVLGWIIAAVTGAAVFVFGLIMLILDLDRRRRAGVLSSATYGTSGRSRTPLGPPPGPDHSRAPTGAPAPPAASHEPPASEVAPGWHPDPAGRHELRYWTGTDWSEHVSTGGKTGVDAL